MKHRLEPSPGHVLPKRTVRIGARSIWGGAAATTAVGALAISMVAGQLGASNEALANARLVSTTTVSTQGFEAGTTGWRVSGGTMTRVTPGHSGTYAVRLMTDAGKNVALNDSPNSVTSTEKGATYTTTAWVKAKLPNLGLHLRIREVNAAGTQVGMTRTYAWLTDGLWHKVTVEHKAVGKGNALDVNVVGYKFASGQQLFVDDVTTTMTSTSSTPTSTPTTSAPKPSTTTTTSKPTTSTTTTSTTTTGTPTTSTTTTGTPTTSSTTASSPPSVPAPGSGVLWGAALRDQSQSSFESFEGSIGRKLGLVYQYYGIDQNLPTAGDAALAKGGRTLHVNIEARQFLKSGHPTIPWRDIANGAYDTSLTNQARGFAALKVPVVLSFEHEVDNPSKLGVRGTAADFVAAWRHIVDVYRANGASNVQWSWVVMGYSGHFAVQPSLWPGNSYVDWISWDPYNAFTCQNVKWRTFEETFLPMYNWLKTDGAKAGIDPNKPYMLSEFGTVFDPNNPQAAADWYKAVPSTLKKYPQIKAVQMWNNVANCDFRLERDATVLSAFAQAGRDSYVAKMP